MVPDPSYFPRCSQGSMICHMQKTPVDTRPLKAAPGDPILTWGVYAWVKEKEGFREDKLRV